MEVAQAILAGLGYEGSHFSWWRARTPAPRPALQCWAPARRHAQGARRFAVSPEKRSTLELALDHLLEQAPQARGGEAEAIALPAGAPFGGITVDKDKCTLCLVASAPARPARCRTTRTMPQLRFVEKNCVQCGLCEKTCPEQAIALQPRLLLTPRAQAAARAERGPALCLHPLRKPFGTLKAIESMLGKLAGHSMFQGAALERLKMCGDCRVIDLYSSTNEAEDHPL
jgi:ferredoxin